MSANTITGYQIPGKIAKGESTEHEIYGLDTEYDSHNEPTDETYYELVYPLGSLLITIVVIGRIAL